MRHCIPILILLAVVSIAIPAVDARPPNLLGVTPSFVFPNDTFEFIISVTDFEEGGYALFSGTGFEILSIDYTPPSSIFYRVFISTMVSPGCHDLFVYNPTGEGDTIRCAINVNWSVRNTARVNYSYPPSDSVLSCYNQFVILSIQDTLPIIPGFTQMTITSRSGSRTYTAEVDPQLTVTDSSVIFIPFEDWAEGDTVFWMLNTIASTGGWISSNLAQGRFFVDHARPQVSMARPAEGATLRDEHSPTITVRITDGPGQWVPESTIVTFQGEQYRYGDPSFSTRGAYLSFYTDSVGYSSYRPDTLSVCLHLVDDAGGCGVNAGDTCWSFYLTFHAVDSISCFFEEMNTDSFPLWSAYLTVLDQTNAFVGNLNQSNLSFFMDGVRVDSFKVLEMRGTSILDVVFIIDETGSMSTAQDSVRTRLVEFADSLSALGYNTQFGLIGYKDLDTPRVASTEGYHLFFDGLLTNDIFLFRDSIASLEAIGGGDAQENLLDAIERGLNDIAWRPDAQKVIIAVTNNTFCQVGDGSWNCQSHFHYREVLDHLLAEEARVFVFADSLPDDPFHFFRGAGGTAPDSSMTYLTEGAYYPLLHPISSILEHFSYLSLGSYIIRFIPRGMGPDCVWHALTGVVRYGGHVATSTDSFRLCSPKIIPLAPPGGGWSSYLLPPLSFLVVDSSCAVDTASIRLSANGTELSITSSGLGCTWRRPDTLRIRDMGVTRFSEGDSLILGAFRATNALGYSDSLERLYRLDFDYTRPTVEEVYPPDSSLLTESPTEVWLQARDPFSGVCDTHYIVRVVSRALGTRTFNPESTGASAADGRIRIDLAAAGMTFPAGDSIHVQYRDIQDNVTYGSVNRVTSYSWDFSIWISGVDDMRPSLGGEWALTPNPFHRQVTLDAPQGLSAPMPVRVTDLLGREVARGMVPVGKIGWTWTPAVETPAGVYWFRLGEGTNEVRLRGVLE